MGSVYDPNYNPGFFGWIWDGLKNPVDAVNSFENTVGKSIDGAINQATSGISAPVNQFLNTNPVGQAVAPILQYGAGYSTTTGAHQGAAAPLTQAPDPNGAPTVGDGATQWAGNNSATSVGYYPEAGSALQTGAPLTASASLPTSALPPGAALGAGGASLSEATAQPYGAPPLGSGMPAPNPGSPGGAPYTPSPVPSAGTTEAAAAAASAAAAGGDGTIPWWVGPGSAAVGGLVGAGGSMLAGSEQAKAASEAAKLQNDQFNSWLQLQKDQFAVEQENTRPWREAGAGALGKLSTFEQDNPNFSFSMTGPNADPSYTFRLNEGMKALQNSAAARGGLMSGNTLKGISNYGQESASQEYNNAFNRYQTEKTGKANRYQSLAGLGQTAVGQANNASQNFSQGAGNAMMGGANALAQGVTGAANARASGYMGAANAGNNALGNLGNYYQSQQYINALTGGR